MKKISCSYKVIRSYYSRIHLVDKCLLIFMLILLLQSAYSLFVLPCTSEEAHTIDVIVRTSISGIFGYFLSANFIRHESSEDDGGTKTTPPIELGDEGNAAVQNSIGFTPPKPDTKLNLGSADYIMGQKSEVEKRAMAKLQIMAATFIGLFCLMTLIIVRNLCVLQLFDTSSSSFIATVSQFRDLVSGCVGFLIGCPTVKK